MPKLERVLKDVEKHGPDPSDYMDITEGLLDVPSQLAGVQEKHREKLRAQTERLCVNTILIKEKTKVFQLVDHYTRLTVISPGRDLANVEHELLARGQDHEKRRERQLRRKLEQIRPSQLFRSSFSRRSSKCGSSAAVSGAPGMGKTTLVQKIVHDWTMGKIFPHFQFVFSFKFRELNAINGRINLRNLVLIFYPYFGNVLGELWKNPEGLLFIFDGLDEFKDSIDFADSWRNTEPQSVCTDPEFRCRVSDIVYGLIQRKLLPGCSMLVTSRPAALRLMEKAEINLWTEILGLVGDERKEYFNKFFEDQAVAAAVFKHAEENEILYTMCYNPSYCWILGLSLGPFFTQRDRKHQQVPKTVTQLYSYYIYNILKNHSREIKSPHDVLLRLGEMAFAGVSQKKVVFRNEDLIQWDLQPSQFLSGFLTELLERDDSAQSVVYTFPHLTVQEFIAALAQFLTPDPGDIRKLLSEARGKEDGRFEIFLRFVAGLSSPQAARPLEELLGPFPHQTTCRVIDWLKEKVTGQMGTGKAGTVPGEGVLLNTMHYLFESQNKALARGSMEALQLGGLRLTPIDCVVLSHVLGMCDAVKELDLEGCYVEQEGLKRLLPALRRCQELGLERNKLRDPGAKLLSTFLRSPDCELQRLQLAENGLTERGAADLAASLLASRSLAGLDLGRNKLGDSGVKFLCEALRNPDCAMEQVKLDDNGLTDSCTEDLSCALGTSRSLTILSLRSNGFTDNSYEAFFNLIQCCQSLEMIGLRENQFTANVRKLLRSVQKPHLQVIV
ncbi:NACHT, LRR and PYD domains-containing protein 3-like isoform X2 [Carcharodon carcharias]|uniref:NACHT, LRR and PYD domains-containing protein 3-like isoform X2 n=1 Tax=Carcharodon carcharias TaxID=13397 RepID=UPI001B7E30C8|nr:NACHT, LRR and PYD domains-containing protein 3-like isoform X2 [Carcharodon carcharias]